jgi:hypothetical protein
MILTTITICPQILVNIFNIIYNQCQFSGSRVVTSEEREERTTDMAWLMGLPLQLFAC